MITCRNCGHEFDPKKHRKCPKCGWLVPRRRHAFPTAEELLLSPTHSRASKYILGEDEK